MRTGCPPARWPAPAWSDAVVAGGPLRLAATFISAMGVLLASLLLAAHAPDERAHPGAPGAGQRDGADGPIAVFVLISAFPPDRKGQAMGMFVPGGHRRPAMGPVVGSIVIEYFNWRAIFYVSVPIAGGIALLLEARSSCPSAPRPAPTNPPSRSTGCRSRS